MPVRTAEAPAQIVLEACESQIGGGALPLEKISSTAVAIRSEYVRHQRWKRECELWRHRLSGE
ncbi:hypothetical protein DW790_03755 [Firmicutes bacterium AM31-12AC]|nr:hypothetical protein DW790_03755 [Firmicutes bacterium AM31-12AC]